MTRFPLFLFAAMTVGVSGALLAQQPEPSLPEQQRALVDARAEAERARARSDALRRQADAATSSADRIAARAAALAARVQSAEADIRAARARIAIVDTLQAGQRARLAEKQRPVVRLTSALQMMTRRPTAVALVEPRSLDDIVHLRAVMSTILPEIERRTANLRAEVRAGERLRAQAARATRSLADSQRQLRERRRQLARLEAGERIAAASLSDDAGLEQDRALALGEEARDILDLMDQIREGGAVRAALSELDGPMLRPEQQTGRSRQVATTARPSANLKGAYRLPAAGDIVTGLGEMSESGYRSRGVTLAVAPDAQLVAPAAGRVAFAGPYRGYDEIVIIEHDASWTTLITGMARGGVEVGDRVRGGAPIGVASGDDPRITIELRRRGRPIDIAALVSYLR